MKMSSSGTGCDAQKNCRVCLLGEGEEELCPLFHGGESRRPYCHQLSECANITVEEGDGLPTFICIACIKELLEAHKFVIKCRETERNLRLMLFTSVDELLIKTDKQITISKTEVDIIIKEEPDSSDHFSNLEDYNPQSDSVDTTNSATSESTVTDSVIRRHYSCKKRGVRHRKKLKKDSNRNSAHNVSTEYPRKCTDCDLVLKCESVKIIHMRKHTNERPFQCSDCGECFKTKNTLKIHCMRRHLPKELRILPDKSFTCSTCQKKFYRKKDMQIHIRTHTGETPHSCTYCPKSFNQMSSLIRHTRTHTGERPYECTLCQKRFASSSELNIHKKAHSQEKKYSCPVCNMAFKTRSALTTHNVIHIDIKEFVCDKCGMSFNKKGNLKLHINRMHSDRAGQCSVCGKTFSKLDEHMRVHTGETPFQCNLCNKTFSWKSRLLSHITYHKGLEKHTCQIAGCCKKFPKKSMLEFHVLKVHKKYTPYICKHCNRGFYRLSDVRRHLKLNHSDVPDIVQDIKDAELVI